MRHLAVSVEEVLALVRSRGGRVSAARRTILEVLFEADDHMSAEELASAVQGRLPNVHMSTVYRNLEDLETLGVLVHSHLGHGPATYQIAAFAHAHLVCESCGQVFEAPEVLFSAFARKAKRELGFTIDPRHFAVLGRCASCTESAAAGVRGTLKNRRKLV